MYSQVRSLSCSSDSSTADSGHACEGTSRTYVVRETCLSLARVGLEGSRQDQHLCLHAREDASGGSQLSSRLVSLPPAKTSSSGSPQVNPPRQNSRFPALLQAQSFNARTAAPLKQETHLERVQRRAFGAPPESIQHVRPTWSNTRDRSAQAPHQSCSIQRRQFPARAARRVPRVG
jgi:hypothetical protein